MKRHAAALETNRQHPRPTLSDGAGGGRGGNDD
jgi:hypothetical protein